MVFVDLFSFPSKTRVQKDASWLAKARDECSPMLMLHIILCLHAWGWFSMCQAEVPSSQDVYYVRLRVEPFVGVALGAAHCDENSNRANSA